ncbi:MAG: M56 family metallopeptidase [Bacteroidia bacterium]|nr:M56 family metallopeptidase [Bacteroidia bacterium]
MSTLSFLLAFTTIAGLLFGYYLLFLRKERQFQLNRFFLLAILPLAFFLPGIEWEMYQAKEIAPVWETTLQSIDITAGKVEEVWVFPFEEIILAIYLGIAALLSLLFFHRLYKISQLIHQSPQKEKKEGFILIRSNVQQSISSFGPYIFWNKDLHFESDEQSSILQHEVCHVRQLHSLDVVFMEIWKIVFWFHPLVYLIDRELKIIHEYQADRAASQQGDQHSYIQLLLSQSLGQKLQLSHSFFQHRPKNRIMMILRKSNSPLSSLKYLLLLPFCFVIFLACTFNINKPQAFTVISGTQAPSPAELSIAPITESENALVPEAEEEEISYPEEVEKTTPPFLDEEGILDDTGVEEYIQNEKSERAAERYFLNGPEVIVPKAEPGIDEFIKVNQEPRPINEEDVKKLIGYPRMAIDAYIQGQVVFRVLVDQYGRIQKYQVVNEVHPILVAAVEKHIEKMIFTPAMKEGMPVKFWVNIPFNFKLLTDKDSNKKKKQRR